MAPTLTSSQLPFNCSFCSVQFGTIEKWKNHLVEEDHLTKTRSSWGIESLKECCLVAAFNGKLKGKHWLLKWFTALLIKKDSGGCQAFKNVLWWDDRPSILVIEYENRKQADAAFANCTKVVADTYIRKADEINDFQWLALFPETIANRLTYANTTGAASQVQNKNGNVKTGRPRMEHSRTPTSSSSSTIPPKIKSEKEDDQASPLEMLNQLAENHGWLPPQFFMSKVGNIENETYYLSVVLVNGVDWARETILCSSEEEAKQQIAMKALDAILDSLKKEKEEKESVQFNTDPPPARPPRLSRPSASPSLKIKTEESIGFNEEKPSHSFKQEDEETEDDEEDSEEEDGDDSSNGDGDNDNSEYKEEVEKSLPPIPTDTCPVQLLQRFAIENGLGLPEYVVSKMVTRASGGTRGISKKKMKKMKRQSGGTWKYNKVFKYSARVVVNGEEYSAPRLSKRYPTMQEAKRYIAWICFNKLSSETVTRVTDRVGVEGKLEGIEQLARAFIASCVHSSAITLPSSSLSQEYLQIRQSVVISDEWFQPILNIVTDLQNLVHYHDPTIDVVMFRTWALKLKNTNPLSGEDEQMIYLYCPDNSGSSTWVQNDTIRRIFQGGNSELEKAFSIVAFEPENNGFNDDTIAKWKVIHNPSGATFSLTSLKSHLLELQTWRLLEYMCTFDIHSHHLIALAQYWSTQNSIHFQDREFARFISSWPLSSQHQVMPESLTVPWLIMFFLSNIGLVPTPRAILKRPHQILRDPISGEDIGFCPDPDFVLSFGGPRVKRRVKTIKRAIPGSEGYDPKEFVYDILDLFRKSLRFLERGREMIGGASWLLNIKDSEWHNKRNFFASRPVPGGTINWISEFTLKEVSSLHGLLSTDPNQDFKDKIDRVPWYMTNPFVVSSRFSCSNKILEIMKLACHTRIAMGPFLSQVKRLVKGSFVDTSLPSLERYLVIGTDVREGVIRDGKFANQRKIEKLRIQKKQRREEKQKAKLEMGGRWRR